MMAAAPDERVAGAGAAAASSDKEAMDTKASICTSQMHKKLGGVVVSFF